MTYELYANFADIVNIYNQKHLVGNSHDLKKAFDFANKYHAGMVRGTGEPFINHPLRVAKLIAEWGFDTDVISAALIHDVVEEGGKPLSLVRSKFNANIASIVESVTNMSEQSFTKWPGGRPLRVLSGELRNPEKMNYKALYVKIAERIDNLSTVSGISEESAYHMALHTRKIVVPMVRSANAFHFADMLEDLCFQVEHPQMYEEMGDQYNTILKANSRKCGEALEILSTVFSPGQSMVSSEPVNSSRYIEEFKCDLRSLISIYRQLSQSADNIIEDWRTLFCKENIPLYDLTLIVSNELSGEGSPVKPNDVFFECFTKALSQKGFYLIRHGYTTYKDTDYFLIADDMDNLYRLFVRTSHDYQRFIYGKIVDEDSSRFMETVIDVSSTDAVSNKIKVFKNDGSSIEIDKGATVLDFAFYVHTELGLHFDYATKNESKTKLDKHTKLNDGDMITVIANESIKPDISWFKHAKTNRAIECLIHYFSKNGNN